MSLPIIELRQVSRSFGRSPGMLERAAVTAHLAKPPAVVRAVDCIDLQIARGSVVGLVGESGCGKSTVGRMVAGMLQPTEGEIVRNALGGNPAGRSTEDAHLNVQMIFQDPFSSLNPRMRVDDIVGEAPRYHRMVNGNVRDYVAAQLRRCGLDPAYGRRFPHELSGGQRQRVGIARALAVNPELLVCDESLAALDVSIQAQIINLFMDLRDQLGLTYLFISHDLSVVRHLADRVVIMYLGRVVEEASVEALFETPNHPYTTALIADAPRVETHRRAFAPIKGELPSPIKPPSGCHFHPRCPMAMPRCAVEAPKLREIGPGHRSACHLNG